MQQKLILHLKAVLHNQSETNVISGGKWADRRGDDTCCAVLLHCCIIISFVVGYGGSPCMWMGLVLLALSNQHHGLHYPLPTGSLHPKTRVDTFIRLTMNCVHLFMCPLWKLKVCEASLITLLSSHLPEVWVDDEKGCVVLLLCSIAVNKMHSEFSK